MGASHLEMAPCNSEHCFQKNHSLGPRGMFLHLLYFMSSKKPTTVPNTVIACGHYHYQR